MGHKPRKNHVMSVKLSAQDLRTIKIFAGALEMEPSTLVREAALDFCTVEHSERRAAAETMVTLMDSFLPKFFFAFEGVIGRLRALTAAFDGDIDELLIEKIKARKLLQELDDRGLATAFSDHMEALNEED
jgi:hypothetical protein